MLLRTFSKVHGLCGLRVGFALCGSEDLPRAVDQVRQPFFCNALAQAAAVEALAHQDAVDGARHAGPSPSAIAMAERLRALGLEPADSQANFCWFELGERDEDEVMQGLPERGVLVRGGGGARRRDARAARHLRHARGERPLPGRAGRGAPGGPSVISLSGALPPLDLARARLLQPLQTAMTTALTHQLRQSRTASVSARVVVLQRLSAWRFI